MKFALVLLPCLLLAAPALAEVVTATPSSFVIKQSVTIAQPAQPTWDMLRSPQKWWDKDHTWSGDAANLYMDAQATGCFCERLPNKGSVEHAHIVFVQPGQMLRLVGSLGPLQGEAVVGTLTFQLEPDGEGATKVTMSYVVSGFARGGMEAIAPAVDGVLGAQLAGLKAAAEVAVPVPPAAKGG